MSPLSFRFAGRPAYAAGSLVASRGMLHTRILGSGPETLYIMPRTLYKKPGVSAREVCYRLPLARVQGMLPTPTRSILSIVRVLPQRMLPTRLLRLLDCPCPKWPCS